MIDVLIADDSVTARVLLAEILAGDPEIRVISEAKDGLEAVQMTRQLHPSVVLMDMHMPRMDGFEATRQIMIETPTPIVIISASFSVNDIDLSMHALRAGALTLQPKPPGPGAPDFDEASRQFIRIVKAMSQVKVVRHWRVRTPLAPPPSRPAAGHGEGVQVIAIAASTGGPAALYQIFSELPGDFPVPILVVQHIAPGFSEGLARWLNTGSSLKVKVTSDGEELLPRMVYLAPDGHHLGVAGCSRIQLSTADPVDGFRPSGTLLFESVARAFGAATLGLILTGMGQDGLQGLQAVRRAGGRIIAQDEESSVVFGMPKMAIDAGLADIVLPLSGMASYLMEVVA